MLMNVMEILVMAMLFVKIHLALSHVHVMLATLEMDSAVQACAEQRSYPDH